MPTERDLVIAYCAGLIDGEGCIRIKRTNAYRELTGRVNRGYHAVIQVRMVDEPAIALLASTLGGWYYKETRAEKTRQLLYCWQATDASAARILTAVLPYLRVKRRQAETVLALRALQLEGRKHRTKITGYRNFPNKYGTPRQVPNRAYSDEFIARCDALYGESRSLNRVGISA